VRPFDRGAREWLCDRARSLSPGWIDQTQVVTTVVGSPEWPGIAPDVVRKPARR
jgi:hypothetical protein